MIPSRVVRLVVPLLLLGLAVVACDSDDLATCIYTDDPAATPGAREARCVPSVFKAEDERAREVVGVVWRGENPVAGAVVRVEPWEGLPSGKRGLVAATKTDLAGFFGGFRSAALRFDLSVKLDDDVMVFRGLAYRYVNAVLEVESASLAAAWRTRLDVQTREPLPRGHTLAFFATGDRAFGVEGDLDRGVSLVGRDFVTSATLHALEYERNGDLSTATAYAKADVLATAGQFPLVHLDLEPITTFVEPTIIAVPPPGRSSPTMAELVVSFSRTSTAHFTTVTLGAKTKLPVIPNAGYVGYRIHAAWDGATSYSGETGMDVYAKETRVPLPEPPSPETPLENATIAITDRLAASGEGVLEHVLEPASGGPTIRLITRPGDTALPAFAAIGAAKPAGAYTWTVRAYPKLQFVDQLAGLDVRRYGPVAASKPRTVIFQ